MVDLNSLLPANSGWELITAFFINDADESLAKACLTEALNGT